MKKYIGIKVVDAEPMSANEFAAHHPLRGKIDPNEDAPGYRVIYEDGYTSWSPKDAFDKAYRVVDKTISVGGVAERIADRAGEVMLKSKSPSSSNPSLATMHRMAEEMGSLSAKIDKLAIFIDRGVAAELPDEIQTLLKQQLYAMIFYLSVLIERFEKMD